jgi:cytidylate kinase
MAEQRFKYRNITVSGPICSGTTTLARLLKKNLGWKLFEAGVFFRKYCQEHGLKLENASDRSDELSKKIDYGMKEEMRRGRHQIFEAWLSGFMARGIAGVLKVLLVAPDDLRIDRLVNRDGLRIEEAKGLIKKRERDNFNKWGRLYGETKFWDPKHYDLIIDTYSHSKEETLEKVLKKLGWKGKVKF